MTKTHELRRHLEYGYMNYDGHMPPTLRHWKRLALGMTRHASVAPSGVSPSGDAAPMPHAAAVLTHAKDCRRCR